jgi:hypothetical protein
MGLSRARMPSFVGTVTIMHEGDARTGFPVSRITATIQRLWGGLRVFGARFTKVFPLFYHKSPRKIARNSRFNVKNVPFFVHWA